MNMASEAFLNLPPRDDEGYLIDPADWNEEVARGLAHAENIVLDEAYWRVLGFMRDFLDEHQVAPDVRHVVKHMQAHWGADARKRLFEHFPYGYVQQACKIAGMRRPRAWSTG